ncbi:MAG: hypothetical protein HKP48_01125 [Winogradskyella sp.]|uniref:hypothetical protein n=1 Tax=Winogradskyella sp. TaxID=1883156 RepID=UPI00183FC3AE|nr:hypothetical protein [Winogradskyella sp.]MBT8246020.1 hypothetical protein [Winogradskyella sp.]NNK21919.1 hypothetical protein [Winogradskyella sp.]
MKKLIACLAFLSLLTSCNVTETIVFTEDGSGEFLMTYDMGEMLTQMKETMGGGNDNLEKKEPGKVIDTTMIFADIMKVYKDSVAALPEEQRLAMEYVKDMYMTMQMDEDAEKMNMGIGMKFKSIEDLKGIQDKIRKAQSLDEKNATFNAMKNQSPLGSITENNDKVDYLYSTSQFSRVTTVEEKTQDEIQELEFILSQEDETSKEILGFYESSYYQVKLVFPKRVKSVNTEGAVISEDGKTMTYKVSWIDYIKNPKSLDVNVTFYE